MILPRPRANLLATCCVQGKPYSIPNIQSLSRYVSCFSAIFPWASIHTAFQRLWAPLLCVLGISASVVFLPPVHGQVSMFHPNAAFSQGAKLDFPLKSHSHWGPPLSWVSLKAQPEAQSWECLVGKWCQQAGAKVQGSEMGKEGKQTQDGLLNWPPFHALRNQS